MNYYIHDIPGRLRIESPVLKTMRQTHKSSRRL